MTRLPPASASGLTRQSTGLSEAHRELIKLLAAKAVAEYLRESEMMTGAVEADDAELQEDQA